MAFQQDEFNNTYKQFMRKLTNKMRFVSYFLLGSGVLLFIVGIIGLRTGGFGSVVQAIIQIIIGIWTGKAASSFQRVVDTQGSDIENLMTRISHQPVEIN